MMPPEEYEDEYDYDSEATLNLDHEETKEMMDECEDTFEKIRIMMERYDVIHPSDKIDILNEMMYEVGRLHPQDCFENFTKAAINGHIGYDCFREEIEKCISWFMTLGVEAPEHLLIGRVRHKTVREEVRSYKVKALFIDKFGPHDLLPCVDGVNWGEIEAQEWEEWYRDTELVSEDVLHGVLKYHSQYLCCKV
jgi:hypothetical protein